MNYQSFIRSIKKIQCIDFYPDNMSSENSLSETTKPVWLILFHGYGADANDLASLASEIRLNKPLHFKFPNGIFEVPIGPGWTGRAWWNLKLSSLPGDWSHYTPEEMEELRTLVFKMISDMNISWNQIILGGFSQGAMLATDLFLNAPETPRGLVSLSGSLISKAEWTELAKQRKNCSVFMSHGEQDQVLPVSGSQKLYNLFKSNELKVDWCPFQGGHEISLKVLQGMNKYLNNILDN